MAHLFPQIFFKLQLNKYSLSLEILLMIGLSLMHTIDVDVVHVADFQGNY